MLVTRKSIVSGKVRTLDLDITYDQLHQYECGMTVQEAFSNLSVDEREFIINGITSDEWDELFQEVDS